MEKLLIENLLEALSRGDIETVYNIWKITRTSKEEAEKIDNILDKNREKLIKDAHAGYDKKLNRFIDIEKLIKRYDVYRIQNFLLYSLETGNFLLLKEFLDNSTIYASDVFVKATKRLYWIYKYERKKYKLKIDVEKPKNIENELA